MKKLFLFIIGAALLVSLVSPSAFAKGHAVHHRLLGTITAIDTTGNTVTIEHAKGKTTTVTADAKQIASLKNGERVRVLLKADGKTAEKFIEIVKKKKKK